MGGGSRGQEGERACSGEKNPERRVLGVCRREVDGSENIRIPTHFVYYTIVIYNIILYDHKT